MLQTNYVLLEKDAQAQIKAGSRFGFGKNWRAFLSTLTDERIRTAEDSLKEMLEIENLKGKSFLDIGSGSGLFSLAAKNLGATVHSFDFDHESVACAQYLKEKYQSSGDWTIEAGSVLDEAYIKSLGSFDIVYSWGVLHHTGNLDLALHHATLPVKKGGKLFISIYNDQGRKSEIWLKVKNLYNANWLGKAAVVGFFFPYRSINFFIRDLLAFKNPIKRYTEYRKERGMSVLHDWHDWLGGLPFEVATPEYIFEFHKARGFLLDKLKTNLYLGCNQFVFRRS